VLPSPAVQPRLRKGGSTYRGETEKPLVADGFAGQMVPVTMSVLPLKDLGTGTLSVSALTGPKGSIPASAVDVGYVSYRLTRVTLDGGVYTIGPRLIVSKSSVALPKGVARRFWLTVRADACAWIYRRRHVRHWDNHSRL
jgi:hypothetical protein